MFNNLIVNMKLPSYSFFLLLVVFSFSCKKERIKETAAPIPKSTIKYAKGFDIVIENGFKKLIIKTGYQNATTIFEYLILNKTTKKATLNNQTIQVPMIVLKLLKMTYMVTGIINFKCMISLEMVRIYTLI